jgi:hypothetical protein
MACDMLCFQGSENVSRGLQRCDVECFKLSERLRGAYGPVLHGSSSEALAATYRIRSGPTWCHKPEGL